MVVVIPPADPSDAALAGMAREVDGLRRDLATLRALPSRVDELGRLLADLAESVSRKPSAPAPSWLMAPADVETTGPLLDELAAWLGAIYLRYPDAADSFPECWCWHPHVVEELAWLMYAWSAAYQGAAASVALAGDWHDRLRPGVVRRIKATAGVCSLENHQTRPGWPAVPDSTPTVSAEDQLNDIAEWWAHRREEPAPEPPARDSAILNGLRGAR